MKRKYWRCRDCKYHQSNKPELPDGLISEPCDTPKSWIICFADDDLDGFCIVPRRR